MINDAFYQSTTSGGIGRQNFNIPKYHRVLWGLYAIVASLVWLAYANYTDPKPVSYFSFFF